DSFIVDKNSNRTIGGLSHLEGEFVVAWGWNEDARAGVEIVNTMRSSEILRVRGGQITVPTAYDNICVGLPYKATFRSAKLAYAATQGSAVNQKKRVDHLGLILYDTHNQGLQYGQRADALDDLPQVSEGVTVPANTVHAEFDEPMIEVPGEWNTDARLHLKA